MTPHDFRNIAEAREWFGNSLFNLLVDYYPEAQSRPYGSGAMPENVLPVLEQLRLGMIIIYAKGHSGYTTFPSALHTEHTRLGRNMPAAFREYTRQTDTRLFLYYSGLVDRLAGLRNPDWRMLGRDGQPFSYFWDFMLGYPIYSLSSYYDEWLSIHFRKMFALADPDGIWVRCAARPAALTWEPGGLPMDHSWEEGVLRVVLPRLEVHTCLVARGWRR